jgi:hypothetical protein
VGIAMNKEDRAKRKEEKQHAKVIDKFENDPRFLVKAADGKGLSEATK